MKNVLVVILLALIFLFSACENRDEGGRYKKINRNKVVNTNGVSRGGGSNSNSRRSKDNTNNGKIQSYTPKTINVPAGCSLQDAMYDDYNGSEKLFNDQNIEKCMGGAKMIAEMSADVYGIYYSRNNENSPINIRICSLNELNMHMLNINSKTYKINIYNILAQGKLKVEKNSVGFHGDGVMQILDFLNAIMTQRLEVFFTIKNTTSRDVTFEIRQGQMLEIANENVQNLVVAETVSYTVAAYQSVEVRTHVYCASHYRGDPSGSSVRFTPFFLNAKSSVYESQQSVWDYIEASYVKNSR